MSMDDLSLQRDVTAVFNGTHTDVEMTPWERIAQANQMALEAAKDPYIRSAAVEILDGCRNVREKGGAWIARWLRKNVTYAEEAPGVEVLQGPFTTLALRHGDCDDLSITWTALARSVGIDAYVAGIARKDAPEVLVHAVGYDNGTNRHWELSRDVRWGGPVYQPLAFKLPSEYISLWWSPEDHRRGYWINRGSGYQSRENDMRICNPPRNCNPYDAKGQWYDAPANGATGKTGSILPGSDEESEARESWRETGQDIARAGADFLFGWLNPAPAGEEESGLAEPPDSPVETIPADRGGMPTWIWGLLGLGAVGGIVWYAVKK